MRLNEYEMQFLHRFLGRINIDFIPLEHFMIVLIMRDRLEDALRAIKNRRLVHEREQS